MVIGTQACGHCQTRHHHNCPGAIASGKQLWVCPCGCVQLRCTECRATDGVDPETWRCRDRAGCDEAVQARLAKDPTIQLIRSLREQAAERVAREVATRRTRTPDGAVAIAPGRGQCECGCGAATKSRFAPGHDARLRGVLQRAYAAGDEEAGLELAARGGVWARHTTGKLDPPADPGAYVAARVAARLQQAVPA